MTTYASYLTQRSTAGSRYQAALVELRAALVDLAALDATVANRNLNSGSSAPVRTFAALPDSLDHLTHPEFAQAVEAPSIAADVRAQRDVYILAGVP